MQLISAAISHPDTAGILLSGAAGVGKSRVAREALSAAESRGCVIRWVVATTAARALPLGAFASFVGSAPSDMLQLVRGVIEALTAARQGAVVIVAVDDVHLLDDLSTFVLQQIVQRRAAKVVVTAREGEPIPAGLQEMWTHDSFERIDLQPISRDETATLLSAALGGRVDVDATRRLWHLTRGNVLYLRNIVEHEVADGRLAERHGFWTWTGKPVVTSSLVEMIEARTGALPAAVGEVIDALAVGEPIELASLCRITDAGAVEEADMRGLIKLDSVDGRVEARLAHPLYGEVRRERAPSTRLRRLRGCVAAELANGDDCDNIRTIVRRATLSLDSDLEPDADLLVKAAHGAVWLADLPLADRLAEAAMRAGGGAEAYIIRGCNLSGLSRGEDAEAILASVPTSGFTDTDHGRLAFVRGMNLMYTLADPARARDVVDELSSRIGADACLDAFHAVYWAALGKPELSLAASRDLVLTELPAVVGAQAASQIALALGDVGRTTDAVAAADAGYAIVDGAFDAENIRFVIATSHVGALLQSGRVREAMLAAEGLRRQWADLPGVLQVLSLAVAGRAALGAGQLDAACSMLQPIDLLIGESNGWGYRYQLPHTVALAMRGSADDAATALASAEKYRHPSHGCVDFELGLARAWVAASQGVVSQAISQSLEAAETAAANGQFAAEVVCLQAATQFGHAAAESRLRTLAEIVEGPRAPLAVRFASALHSRDGAELAAVSHGFEETGDLIAAADAAAHAALICRGQDLRGSAYTYATRAEGLAELCGGAITPALHEAVEPVPLSSREREIVALIAEGLSNREVADRLCLSVRTIEGHIYRAMARTGVSNREELSGLLKRRR
ncbi:response regulator containing a CheY-like receiver domain and an HTH DNA-binding domain [Mycobacterium sp. JS623]|nr:helix-turn-helix transcriptional regulator [Mycobacterium sp. JS623]AGB26423.1 response regulator containing a CheY-like receiver domain and an HTH DNA-binding domain [Mycobacterium sp. JS623]